MPLRSKLVRLNKPPLQRDVINLEIPCRDNMGDRAGGSGAVVARHEDRTTRPRVLPVALLLASACGFCAALYLTGDSGGVESASYVVLHAAGRSFRSAVSAILLVLKCTDRLSNCSARLLCIGQMSLGVHYGNSVSGVSRRGGMQTCTDTSTGFAPAWPASALFSKVYRGTLRLRPHRTSL